jgi:hypothetical protein
MIDIVIQRRLFDWEAQEFGGLVGQEHIKSPLSKSIIDSIVCAAKRKILRSLYLLWKPQRKHIPAKLKDVLVNSTALISAMQLKTIAGPLLSN